MVKYLVLQSSHFWWGARGRRWGSLWWEEGLTGGSGRRVRWRGRVSIRMPGRFCVCSAISRMIHVLTLTCRLIVITKCNSQMLRSRSSVFILRIVLVCTYNNYVLYMYMYVYTCTCIYTSLADQPFTGRVWLVRLQYVHSCIEYSYYSNNGCTRNNNNIDQLIFGLNNQQSIVF